MTRAITEIVALPGLASSDGSFEVSPDFGIVGVAAILVVLLIATAVGTYLFRRGSRRRS